MVEVAAVSGVPIETLRKIETGRIVTPAFFTVAALARVLDVPLETLAPTEQPPLAAVSGLVSGALALQQ